MKVRPATKVDAAAIADLWNGMIRDTLATFTTEEKSEADIKALIASRAQAFWVAQSDHVAGFVTFDRFRPGPGYAATVEHSIILSPSAQRHGVGRSLMTVAQDAAIAQGKHIMVAGISSANPGAVAFHHRLGFTETARMPQVGRKAGQWLDLILMQKTLSAS